MTEQRPASTPFGSESFPADPDLEFIDALNGISPLLGAPDALKRLRLLYRQGKLARVPWLVAVWVHGRIVERRDGRFQDVSELIAFLKDELNATELPAEAAFGTQLELAIEPQRIPAHGPAPLDEINHRPKGGITR